MRMRMSDRAEGLVGIVRHCKGFSVNSTKLKERGGIRAPSRLLEFSRNESALQANDECGPAIQTTRFLARIVVFWPLLTEAHGLEPVGRNSACDQVVANGGGASVPECEVVLSGADV